MKLRVIQCICGLLLLLLTAGCSLQGSSTASKAAVKTPTEDLAWAQDALRHVLGKVKSNSVSIGNKLPHYTEHGKYVYVENGGWTGAFWTGMLWLSYQYEKSDWALETARKTEVRLTRRIEKEQSSLDHDVGFLALDSVDADFLLTGNQAAKETTIKGAQFLYERFNPQGKFIKAWNSGSKDSEAVRLEQNGKVIVDSMMNIPLLFRGAQMTGNPAWKQAAIDHANTIAQYLIREDGSSFHTFVFNPTTGTPIGGKTHQGYSDDSCWSRGQAWLIYGFSAAYHYTDDVKYLETAHKVADYFLNHLPEDGIPYWDFKLPSFAGEPRDSSAAAIAASGLLSLSALEKDTVLQEKYKLAALKLLQKLHENYETKPDDPQEGILTQGCSFKKNGNCGNSLIYGDYFYMEALMKLLKQDFVPFT
jgi:unsaturated chondroitin disaccharide hydrolase